MKKLLFVSVLVLISITTSSAQQWQKYKSQDLAFIAYFPDEPKRSVQKIPSAVGDLEMHMVMYTPESGDDNAVYSVIRSDYPKEQFKNANAASNAKILDGAVQGALNNVDGTLEFEKKITFNGYPARDVKISIQGAYIYIRAYLVEHTMYITQIVCLSANDGNTNIAKFLDGFDIIKVK